jgi:hypothetical protein
MKDLFRKLEAATQIYSNFQFEYKDDIASIKRYATKEIVDKLWTLKARGKKDRRASFDSQDDIVVEDSVEYEAKFVAWKKKVAEVLDNVINSATKGGKGYSKKTNRQESMDRLRGKVPTANNQILPLLDAVAKEREECKALIIELERLRTLFNPDNDSNKELYNGDDSEYVGGYGNVEDLSESKQRDW